MEKHARYEEQLRRNKELMEEAERQLKEMFDKGEKGSLLSPVASEQEKLEELDKSKVKTNNHVRPYTDDD